MLKIKGVDERDERPILVIVLTQEEGEIARDSGLEMELGPDGFAVLPENYRFLLEIPDDFAARCKQLTGKAVKDGAKVRLLAKGTKAVN